MDILNDPRDEMKERHGCVTAWLIFMLVANSIVMVMYLFARGFIQNKLPSAIPSWAMMALGFLGMANIIFAIELLRWKKWAFWGFAVASIITAGINLEIGTGLLKSLLGLLGIIILYGILRITRDGVSAWDNLD